MFFYNKIYKFLIILLSDSMARLFVVDGVFHRKIVAFIVPIIVSTSTNEKAH